MKKSISSLIILTVFTGTIYYFSPLISPLISLMNINPLAIFPEKTQDNIRSLFDGNTPERKCFNSYIKGANDPESMYMVSGYVISKKLLKKGISDEIFNDWYGNKPVGMGYEEMISIEVRGKNKLGGIVTEQLYCPAVNGDFDSSEMLKWKYR